MLSKKSLLQEFQKSPDDHWKVGLFDEKGFHRVVCKKCGKGFWTLGDRTDCPEHEDYGFIGESAAKAKWDYLESWKEFEKFFNKNGHKTIPRYPVISRWHPTLFFTQASIQDFQRFDGDLMEFDYPANPLIVPQTCLRFNDIENVGITGRHMTCFVMAGQHAFNDDSRNGYWKDRCMELNFEFLSEVMGIPKDDITYIEDMWAMNDMSAFGPSMESFSRGLEIVNSVFMQYQGTGSSYRELPLKVIDVGWGFDRFSWFAQGTPTIYDAAFGDVVGKLKRKLSLDYDEELFRRYAAVSKSLDIDDVPDLRKAREDIARKLGVDVKVREEKIGPMEAAYALMDHSRTLAFAISDGGLPSNVGGGYNLRVIARRAMSFIDKYKWDVRMEDVALWHAEYLKKMFPELSKNEDEIVKVLDMEAKKFRQNRERSRRLVDSMSGKEVSVDDLVKLYDSEGVTPEQLGIEVPPEFYDKVTERHTTQEREDVKSKLDVTGVPPTKILYYEEPYIFEFQAKVIAVLNENFVVLDQTAFYPTSGGQLHDTGTIDNLNVTEVLKVGKVIVHRMFGTIESGKTVKCVVDRKRREKLMHHHDAVHIVNGATKKVLGSHVNQAGAEKDVDKARLDITHYEALTDDEVEKIEKLANEVVERDIPIRKHEMPRGKAEQSYGFRIYQGGYVPSKDIRVVEVQNFDIEACGGTHGHSTGGVGPIKITKTKKIADGLVRIELMAGDAAFEYMREKSRILGEVAGKLNVEEVEVPRAVERLFDTWKKLRKEKK